jgi:3-methylfumaryl-CoA hydratase
MTMLLDEVRKRHPGAAIARFEMRAMRPLFDGQAFALCGRDEPATKSVQLWSRDGAGAQCTDASAWLR